MKGKNQFITNLIGSMENMTAVKAKDGDTIIKGKITQMTNPNSTGQQFNRTRFAAVIPIAAAMGKYWPDTFKKAKPTQSEYNARTSHFMDVARADESFTVPELLASIDFTRGTLYPLNVTYDAGNSADNLDGTFTLAFEWDYDAESLAQDGTDEIFYAFFNPTTQAINISNVGRVRSDGDGDFIIPIPDSGLTYVAVFARSTDGVLVSTESAVVTLSSVPAVAEL